MKTHLPLLALFTLACADPEPTAPVVEPTPEPEQGPMALSPNGPITGDVEEQFSFDVSGVLEGSAYRVTLVAAANLTLNADGTGVFVDADANGAADAGPSEQTALLFHIHYNPITPNVKTYPGAADDPANPSGIFPLAGDTTFGFGVVGVGGGTVYPVIYSNGGASTFLEIDESGVPIEPYVIGPAITINEPPPPPPPIEVAPQSPQDVGPTETYDYTISGLNDAYYYRVTLVLNDNIIVDGTGGATFIDTGAGTANAGASQDVALITYAAGATVEPGAKTVPSPDDDPAAPTGLQSTGGQITLTLTGVADGMVYPVAYRNGGASTFLEIDGTGAPIEDYAVGGPPSAPVNLGGQSG